MILRKTLYNGEKEIPLRYLYGSGRSVVFKNIYAKKLLQNSLKRF